MHGILLPMYLITQQLTQLRHWKVSKGESDRLQQTE